MIQQQNLPGHAPSSLKTINVECNLLDTWLESRDKEAQTSKRRYSWLALASIVSAACLPLLFGFAMQQRHAANIEASSALALRPRLADWVQRRAKLSPNIIQNDLITKSGKRLERLLSIVTNIFSDIPPEVVLTNSHVDVSGGTLTTKLRATAVTPEAAQRYVTAVGLEPGVASAFMVSRRREVAVGATGVTFEFVVRAGVEQ